MELKMFIGDHCIDTIPINISKLNLPGYIQYLKTELEEKHKDILDLNEEDPKFFIDTVPSGMNFSTSKFIG